MAPWIWITTATASWARGARGQGFSGDGHYYRLAYHLRLAWNPLGGVMFSDSRYTASQEMKVLDAGGSMRTSSVFLIQPLIERDTWRLAARIQYDEKRLDDQVGLLLMQSAKRSRVSTYQLSGSSGATHMLLGVSQGRLDINGSLFTLSGTSERGDFRVARAALERLQPLSQRLALHGRVQGQWSRDNLDESEKMYLGGALGVRAYPQGEAAGDRGWQGSLELRYDLTEAWQLAGFADYGRARLNTPLIWSADTVRSLAGAGLGARWAAGSWHFSAVAAWRLGDAEPQSDEDRTPRVWTQLVRYF